MTERIVDFGDDGKVDVRIAMAKQHGAVVRGGIVHCRDCMYYRDGIGRNGRRYSEPYCGNIGELAYGALFEVSDDWFCADGQRKVDE